MFAVRVVKLSSGASRRIAEIRGAGTRGLLLMLNVTDGYIDKEALSAFKQAGRDVGPYMSGRSPSSV